MHRPADVIVPPFLIDDEATRKDLASYYNEVTRFDHYIGEVVAELKAQNAYENTLLFILADNGRPFPRAKTRLHDSGMKTALVAHWPAGIAETGPSDRLVSVIDLAPTILDVAGLKPFESMQGTSMQPLFEDSSASIRRYAFSEHNWHDYEAHGRSIRHGDYVFLKNFRPALPLQGPADSVRSPSFTSLKSGRDAKKLTTAQQDVFLAPRPEVELYNFEADPHQLTNLAGKAEYASRQAELSEVLAQWMKETGDSVPKNISGDTFDRESGHKIKGAKADGTTPGEDKGADKINASGPR